MNRLSILGLKMRGRITDRRTRYGSRPKWHCGVRSKALGGRVYACPKCGEHRALADGAAVKGGA